MSVAESNLSGPAPVSHTYKSARFWVGVGVSALVVIWVAVIASVFTQALPKIDITKPAPGTDLSLLLAPIIAAAAGIERVLEAAFSYFETRLRWIVAFLAQRISWFEWARSEVIRINDALNRAASDAQALDPLTEAGQKAQEALEVLEQQVEAAEKRLDQLVTFVEYKNIKGSLAIIIGLWLGVLVATAGSIRIFAALGIPIESHVDVILTGLIIGTGSQPVHSLIGILQQTKDTLDGAQGFLKAKGGAVAREAKNTVAVAVEEKKS